ncbi:endonuclease VII domain-containing protein [Streptomyces rishiriensis]|uniref:endonuclease VII domain-containing protein n=1 Tax=Streptomyces rishiriensis TaxID=68264 RepID=UPI0037CE9C8B
MDWDFADDDIFFCDGCSDDDTPDPRVPRRDKTLCVRCDRVERQVRRYRITVPQMNAIMRFQGDVCALCQEAPPIDYSPDAVSFWHIDHDHRCCAPGGSCGRCVRGLLCLPCNATRVPPTNASLTSSATALASTPTSTAHPPGTPKPAPPPGTMQAPATHPATSSTPFSPPRIIPTGTPSAPERRCPPGAAAGSHGAGSGSRRSPS